MNDDCAGEPWTNNVGKWVCHTLYCTSSYLSHVTCSSAHVPTSRALCSCKVVQLCSWVSKFQCFLLSLDLTLLTEYRYYSLQVLQSTYSCQFSCQLKLCYDAICYCYDIILQCAVYTTHTIQCPVPTSCIFYVAIRRVRTTQPTHPAQTRSTHA